MEDEDFKIYVEDTRIRQQINNLTQDFMTKFVEWLEILGPVKANEKHNQYIEHLENLRKVIKGIRARRWVIVEREWEVLGQVVSSDTGTELLVKMAKMRIADDMDHFKRTTFQKVSAIVKKRTAVGDFP